MAKKETFKIVNKFGTQVAKVTAAEFATYDKNVWGKYLEHKGIKKALADKVKRAADKEAAEVAEVATTVAEIEQLKTDASREAGLAAKKIKDEATAEATSIIDEANKAAAVIKNEAVKAAVETGVKVEGSDTKKEHNTNTNVKQKNWSKK